MKKYNLLLVSAALLLTPFLTQAENSWVGKNVMTPDGTVYMFFWQNDHLIKRPYTSGAAFSSYGFNSWNQVEAAGNDLSSTPNGDFIPPRDGSIVCDDARVFGTPSCYLISNGEKRKEYYSGQGVIFKQWGLPLSKKLYGDVTWMREAPAIEDANMAHIAGTVIILGKTVYVVGPNNKTFGVPSMAVLASWGYSTGDIVKGNQNDLALEMSAVLQLRQPGQLMPY